MAELSTIHPVHFSIRRMLKNGFRVRPRDMDYMEGMTNEQSETLQKIAMEIFVDCTNVGVPFQEAIGAVYLSGLNHGHFATKDRESK